MDKDSNNIRTDAGKTCAFDKQLTQLSNQKKKKKKKLLQAELFSKQRVQKRNKQQRAFTARAKGKINNNGTETS